MSGSYVTNNTAAYGGGIETNYSTTFTVTDSIIRGNTATNNGGGIYSNGGKLTISGCDFESNLATGDGNAIFNLGGNTSNRVIRYCRFYDLGDGYEIYCASNSLDAQYNWWGSNSDPSSKVYGNVDVDLWLVLTLTANPSIIGKNLTSTVTADLLHDSDGVIHDDGPNVLIIFSTDFCSITSIIFTVNGVANATFTSGDSEGVANITALLDDQIAHTLVTVDGTAPTISSTDPIDGTVVNDTSQVVTVTFSEDILEGVSFDDINISSNGTPLPP